MYKDLFLLIVAINWLNIYELFFHVDSLIVIIWDNIIDDSKYLYNT